VIELPFTQVDAFADRPFTGNPAAVVLLKEWLPDDLLQAIAAEHNMPETAFAVPVNENVDYELRWFTPEIEVALCGHATLAAGHVLMKASKVRFRTRLAGILEVSRDGGDYALSLPALKPEPKPLPRIVAALGCHPVETLWREEGYAMIVLADEEGVSAVAPDFRALADEGNITTIVTAPGQRTDVVSRAFVPAAGIEEDAVCGAAHAVITPYWTERLGQPTFTVYQASRRGGHLRCRLDGNRAILGGKCVTVIEGVMRI
jgi:PhzF family phenazine biosynthesis protein